jgi:hypothetical protein
MAIRNSIAKALDATARKAYDTGTAIGGEAGGRVADTITNATLGSARRLTGVDQCTCSGNCQHQ